MASYPVPGAVYVPAHDPPRQEPPPPAGAPLLARLRWVVRSAADRPSMIAFTGITRLVRAMQRHTGCSEAAAVQGVNYFLLTGEVQWNGITLEIRYREGS